MKNSKWPESETRRTILKLLRVLQRQRYYSLNALKLSTIVSTMMNDNPNEPSAQHEAIDDGDGNSRNKGPQPIIEVMQQYNLRPRDLVEASTEQLTHKMVARAMKGRQLTINTKGIVQRALNQATSKVWTQSQLFNY